MSTAFSRYTCSKHFEDFPCAHRQWRHSGHCKFVHGYSRSFTFWFGANELDGYGFVVDFSSLREIEKKLREQFDHTFLVNSDDPLLSDWQILHQKGVIQLRVMENVGMESSAKFIWELANEYLLEIDRGRTCCWRTQASENKFNAAQFDSFPSWFNMKT